MYFTAQKNHVCILCTELDSFSFKDHNDCFLTGLFLCLSLLTSNFFFFLNLPSFLNPRRGHWFLWNWSQEGLVSKISWSSGIDSVLNPCLLPFQVFSLLGILEDYFLNALDLSFISPLLQCNAEMCSMGL